MVRRITPVTERCQPPSSVTRGARPLPLLRPLQPRGALAPRPPSPRRRRAGCAAASTACGACRPRLQAQTESPPPPRRRYPAGTPRTRSRPRGRSFTRLGVVRGRHQRGAGGGVRGEGWLHALVGRLAGPLHAQLLEQEGEGFLEISPDRRAHALRQVPEPLLEGPDRLLAALIEELLLGIALLPFFFLLGLDPL